MGSGGCSTWLLFPTRAGLQTVRANKRMDYPNAGTGRQESGGKPLMTALSRGEGGRAGERTGLSFGWGGAAEKLLALGFFSPPLARCNGCHFGFSLQARSWTEMLTLMCLTRSGSEGFQNETRCTRHDPARLQDGAQAPLTCIRHATTETATFGSGIVSD